MDNITTFVPQSFVPHSVELSDKQRSVADKIISIFENGTTTIQYGYAEVNPGDEEHGITAGRLGFTSATGDMLELLEDYYNVAPLSGYIEELKRLNELYIENDYMLSDDPEGSMNVKNLDGLIEDWKEEGKKPAFQDAQDRYLDAHYYNPALVEAKEIGLTLPLSSLCLYDCAIQHGVEGLREIIHSVELLNPHTQQEEISWIKQFNKNRLEVLKSKSYWQDSLYRVETLNDLLASEKYFLNISKVVIKSWGNEEFILDE
jgi:chitosanase